MPPSLNLRDVYRQRLVWLILSVWASLLAATVWHFGVRGQEGYPHSTFLCDPSFRFGDLREMISLSSRLDPYDAAHSSIYPPFAVWVYRGLGVLDPFVVKFWALIAPLLLSVGAIWRLMGNLPTGLRGFAAVSLVLLPYPVWFAFDRGNLDLWILALLLCFSAGWERGGRRGDSVAGFSMGLAIALKVYPILFLALPLTYRRWRLAVLALGTAVLLSFTAASMFPLGAIGTIHSYLDGLQRASTMVSGDWLFARFNLGLYHFFWLLQQGGASSATLAFILSHYGLLAALAVGGFFVVILRSQPPEWLTMAGLSLSLVIFPSLSNDYRGVLVIPSLVLALRYAPDNRAHRALLILMASYLLAKNYWVVHPEVGTRDVALGSYLNPLLGLAAWLLVIVVAAQTAKTTAK